MGFLLKLDICWLFKFCDELDFIRGCIFGFLSSCFVYGDELFRGND